MTFYGMNAARRTRAFSIAALALGLRMAGCSSDPPRESASEVGTAYQALAVQLQNCASNGLDCYQAANCDDAAEQACRDELHACREATRDAYRAYHQAIGNCFRAKLECVHDAWSDGGATSDGGAADFQACRDQFHACVEVDRPIPAEPGPCMSGLRACVETNVQWGEDGSRAALHDCLSEAHQCIQNRLPMCEDEAGAGGAGGAGAEGGFGGAGGATDGGV